MEDYAHLFDVQTPEEIMAIVKTQEVKDAESKATAYEDQMTQLETDIAKIDKDVDNELS